MPSLIESLRRRGELQKKANDGVRAAGPLYLKLLASALAVVVVAVAVVLLPVVVATLFSPLSRMLHTQPTRGLRKPPKGRRRRRPCP